MSNFVFTTEQSSAIANINFVSNNIVEVAYQSNPDKFYTYEATDDVIEQITQVAEKVSQNEPVFSIGAFIAARVRGGELKQVELATI